MEIVTTKTLFGRDYRKRYCRTITYKGLILLLLMYCHCFEYVNDALDISDSHNPHHSTFIDQ